MYRHHSLEGVSVAVVDKSKGRFREIRQFGVAHNDAEVEALVSQANHWIRQYGGQQLIDFQAGHVCRQSDIDMFAHLFHLQRQPV